MQTKLFSFRTSLIRKNKNVILLSSSHSGNSLSPENGNKPTMILDYNRGKAGVDQLDQNIDEFTCRRKTVRWPLIVFYNVLDVGCYNAYLLLKAQNPNLQRKVFIKQVAFQLTEKHAKIRHAQNNHLPQPVKDAGILLGLHNQSRSRTKSRLIKSDTVTFVTRIPGRNVMSAPKLFVHSIVS